MILVTGATGFVGKNLVPELIKRDKVRIFCRQTSDLKFYQGRLKVEMSFGSLRGNAGLERALDGIGIVIHVAGQTMGRNRIDFDRTNVEGTRNLVKAIRKRSGIKLVHISSLAAVGAGRDLGPVSESCPTRPITDYGHSKLGAEKAVIQARIPHVILRPPMIYGPHDLEFLKFIRLIQKGICPMVGSGRMFVSMIYVLDLVGAVCKVLDDDRFDGGLYFTSDGEIHSYPDVIALIARQLNRRRLWRIPVPFRIALLYGVLNDVLVPEKKRMISRDHIRVMKHAYWLCSNERMVRDLGYKPIYDLDRGLAETIGWYRRQGLLK